MSCKLKKNPLSKIFLLFFSSPPLHKLYGACGPLVFFSYQGFNFASSQVGREGEGEGEGGGVGNFKSKKRKRKKKKKNSGISLYYVLYISLGDQSK